jgi:MerR family mercuric resistance operon transcriptional regulator
MVCSHYRLKLRMKSATKQAVLLIGDLSQRTGCNIETIRYYERIGLLPPAQRRGRYRSYTQPDVARLSFVMRSRELGFSLDEVRALLGLSESTESSSCGDAQRVAIKHLTDMRTRIRDLRRMEKVLDQTIKRCKTGKPGPCPLIEALSGRH